MDYYSRHLDVKVRLKVNTTLQQLLVRPKDLVSTKYRTGIIPLEKTAPRPMWDSLHGQLITCKIKKHQCAVKIGDVNTSAIVEHAWQC